MIESVFNEKIKEYNPAGPLEQEHVLRELMQQCALTSLSRSGFFETAVFHGGTCLRLFHGLERFSEDLDFMLKEPDPEFGWARYLDSMARDFAHDGIRLEINDRTTLDDAVKKAFLKTDSVGKSLLLELPYHRHSTKKIRIKLEIDCNPPPGSDFETSYLYFPIQAAVTTQPLDSGFAGKSHAMLCRDYTKGRDWYDFLWYVIRETGIDLNFLENALLQQSKWAGNTIHVSPEWYCQEMGARIDEMDWKAAREDVKRFVPSSELYRLELWDRDFFHHHLARLEATLDRKA